MADSRDEANTRIKVILRVRPPDKRETDWFKKGQQRNIFRDTINTSHPDTRIIIDRTNKSYDFDCVFREESTQRMLFKTAALPTLENVFAGYCGAVLAYGQTGTGKTHTMQGYAPQLGQEQKGIIPRCADYIFSRIEKSDPIFKFTVSLNFVQIYLDKLQDLFQPEAPEVTINPETERVELPGITEHVVTSAEQFMKMFYFGEKHRVTRATMMNETSSRGHAALIVHIRMEPQDEEGRLSTKIGKLVLVDLAGYERFTLTGATGIAAEEAKKINASLLALGSVVNALADACSDKKGQHHIPYRNAKLTRLLKDCLGGTSVSTIICTVGPCDKYNQETSGTLYFGWRAMAVKVNAQIKEVYDPAKYTMHLKNKLTAAHERIKTLVQFFKKASPSGWDAYVKSYGEPEVRVDFDDDDEEAAIIAALNKMESPQMLRRHSGARRGSIDPGQVNRILNGQPVGATAPPGHSIMHMSATDILQTDELDINPDAPAELKAVQKNWNMEIRHQKEQAERELDMLRLRHLQDLEEARAAGVDESVLQQLRKEHEQELYMMREQNLLLKEEILRQKQKEEAKALLLSAKQANSTVLQSVAASNGASEVAKPVTEMQRHDEERITDICTHLQETCNNKDDVLVRMFDLICYYEAQIQDNDLNAQAIAVTHADEVASQDKQQLRDSRSREEKLRRELEKKDAEIARLKHGGGIPQSPSHVEVSLPRTNSLGSQRSFSFTGNLKSTAALNAAMKSGPAPAQRPHTRVATGGYHTASYAYSTPPQTPPASAQRGQPGYVQPSYSAAQSYQKAGYHNPR